MIKIKETHLYDLMKEEDRKEFQLRYWKLSAWNWIAFIWEDWCHYIQLTTDVIQPIKKYDFIVNVKI